MVISKYPCPECKEYVHFRDGHWMRVWHSDGVSYTYYHRACWLNEKARRQERQRRQEEYKRFRASVTIGTPSYSPVKAEVTVEKEF